MFKSIKSGFSKIGKGIDSFNNWLVKEYEFGSKFMSASTNDPTNEFPNIPPDILKTSLEIGEIWLVPELTNTFAEGLIAAGVPARIVKGVGATTKMLSADGRAEITGEILKYFGYIESDPGTIIKATKSIRAVMEKVGINQDVIEEFERKTTTSTYPSQPLLGNLHYITPALEGEFQFVKVASDLGSNDMGNIDTFSLQVKRPAGIFTDIEYTGGLGYIGNNTSFKKQKVFHRPSNKQDSKSIIETGIDKETGEGKNTSEEEKTDEDIALSASILNTTNIQTEAIKNQLQKTNSIFNTVNKQVQSIKKTTTIANAVDKQVSTIHDLAKSTVSSDSKSGPSPFSPIMTF